MENNNRLNAKDLINVGIYTESGRTVLVSTHDGELVNNCCEHVMYIENGKVVRFE